MRGDVYRYKGAKAPKGHEQDGARFAVVVQSDALPLSTWVIALTSASAPVGPLRPVVVVDARRTSVMVDQLVTVDPETRLGALVGRLTTAEMAEVDEALRVVLGLD